MRSFLLHRSIERLINERRVVQARKNGKKEGIHGNAHKVNSRQYLLRSLRQILSYVPVLIRSTRTNRQAGVTQCSVLSNSVVFGNKVGTQTTISHTQLDLTRTTNLMLSTCVYLLTLPTCLLELTAARTWNVATLC